MLSLTGFIIFIDHASEEIGNKKNLAHQKGARSETKFEYGYGISLLMFGTSVIFSEFCGFAYGAFYLHYYRHRYVYRMPQFAIMDRGDPISDAMLHYKIVATRCLNEGTFSTVNNKLHSYRAPSKSCNDLTRGRDYAHERNVAYVTQRQDGDWSLKHQIVKSNSVYTIKANSNANQDGGCAVDSGGNSVNPIACPTTSATTLYSRVTEV